MEEIIKTIIIISVPFITFCLITLNENKDELWEEICKKLRR